MQRSWHALSLSLSIAVTACGGERTDDASSAAPEASEPAPALLCQGVDIDVKSGGGFGGGGTGGLHVDGACNFTLKQSSTGETKQGTLNAAQAEVLSKKLDVASWKDHDGQKVGTPCGDCFHYDLSYGEISFEAWDGIAEGETNDIPRRIDDASRWLASGPSL